MTDARQDADALLYADVRGIDSHGVSNMMPIYVAMLESGFTNPTPNPRIVSETDAAATIVFLGGSTTECMFVQPELRFPHLAGKLIGERLGTRVDGVNGGKSGNNTMHSLLVLSAKVIPMRPDIVVLMHNTNDLAILARGESYWPDSGTFGHVQFKRRDLEISVRNVRDLLVPRTYRAIRHLLRNASFDFIRNANATLDVQREFGSLDAYLWQFVDGQPRRNASTSLSEIPAETDASRAMSRDLKQRGFSFVGPTICYAFMQATGMVNDHTVSCFRDGEV